MELDSRRVRELLDYNRKTGKLTWRRARRGRYANVGDLAGSTVLDPANPIVRIGIDGKVYSIARIIYLYVTGDWPRSPIRYRDGDPANLRWSNFYLRSDNISNTKGAAYQRQQRAINAAAMLKIRSDTRMSREYYDPLMQRSVMKAARDLVREERKQRQREFDKGTIL